MLRGYGLEGPDRAVKHGPEPVQLTLIWIGSCIGIGMGGG